MFFCSATILCINGDNITVTDNTARIEAVVPNVSKLGKFDGPEATVRGVNWRLIVSRRGNVLDVFLRARPEIVPGELNTIKQNDTYDVEGTFELLPIDPSEKPFKKGFDTEEYPYFQWTATRKGCRGFITVNEFIVKSKRFVRDDKATFAIQFTVGEPISILDRFNPALFS